MLATSWQRDQRDPDQPTLRVRDGRHADAGPGRRLLLHRPGAATCPPGTRRTTRCTSRWTRTGRSPPLPHPTSSRPTTSTAPNETPFVVGGNWQTAVRRRDRNLTNNQIAGHGRRALLLAGQRHLRQRQAVRARHGRARRRPGRARPARRPGPGAGHGVERRHALHLLVLERHVPRQPDDDAVHAPRRRHHRGGARRTASSTRRSTASWSRASPTRPRSRRAGRGSRPSCRAASSTTGKRASPLRSPIDVFPYMTPTRHRAGAPVHR